MLQLGLGQRERTTEGELELGDEHDDGILRVLDGRQTLQEGAGHFGDGRCSVALVVVAQ